MSHFVGLDVSQKMTAICVVDGRRIWRTQCRCDRRSLAHPPIPRHRCLSGLGPQAVSVGRGRLCRRHLQMRRSADADAALRGRQCHADALQGPAQAQGLGLRDRQVIHDPKARIPLACRLGIIMHALLRDAAVARKCRSFPEGVMNGSFPSLPDVRQGETTPPVAKAFTMPVATVDALDATQCTLEHSFGVSPQRPRNRRARCANALRRYPRSLRREESAKATLSPIIIAN
jgi:hypothetical protein